MASFDDAAVEYDDNFSFSEIGSRLRTMVQHMLRQYIIKDNLDVLEINCGTGEDALYFSKIGHNVTATDASEEMIRVASMKAGDANPIFKAVDFKNLAKVFEPQSFDVVFSNFGGLNCASEEELKTILKDVHTVLKRGGIFIGVIMSSRCTWELLYYVSKMDFKKAFRRYKRNGVDTTIGSHHFKTYYFSPSQTRKLGAAFNYIDARPVGLFIPPTYLEHYFKKHTGLLDTLLKFEKRIGKMSSLSNLADHFMIVLEKAK